MSTTNDTAATYRIDSPSFVADPYPLYAWMRSEAPVRRLEPSQLIGVSRYEDVVFVLKNPKLFSNAAYQTVTNKRQVIPGLEPAPSLVGLDPPRHTQMRALVSRAFTPRVVAALEPRIREISRDLVNRMAAKGTFDLVTEFTIPLPMIVIAELLGVEPERREQFKQWCDDMLSNISMVTAPDRERSDRAAAETSRYFLEVIEARRAEPKDDLISMLIKAEVDGQKLTPSELISFANVLLIAGNETTTSLIGNALYALTSHPDQYAKMLAERSRIPDVVEETLRWMSPAQVVFRTATEDVTLSGTTIPAGSIVGAMIGSANRDERRFPDPDRFDIERDTKGHIAFGLDIHFCLGAPLARLEGKVALEELSALGELRRAKGPVPWAPSLLLRAPLRLDLTTA